MVGSGHVSALQRTPIVAILQRPARAEAAGGVPGSPARSTAIGQKKTADPKIDGFFQSPAVHPEGELLCPRDLRGGGCCSLGAVGQLFLDASRLAAALAQVVQPVSYTHLTLPTKA